MNTVFSSRTHAGRNGKIGAFRRAAYVGSLLGFLGVVACTATATIGPAGSSCSTDSSLSCVTGTTGYSCTGSAQPEDSNSDLVCSTDGAGDFCCSTSTCSYSSSVSCPGGGTGYSCTTGAPSPSSSDSALTCSTPTTANNVDQYCCTTGTTMTTAPCNADSTVSCSVGTGFTCTGSSQPEDTTTSLVCSADVGTGQFCCVTGSACAYDSSLSCETGAVGYNCTGSADPNSVDSSLICSEPNANNSYCCFTQAYASGVTTSTCTQDQTVQGCVPNAAGQTSYGFSCTGSDTPDQDFSSITCSTGTAGTGATLFCCVYN
jgi:hypothetical protein